MAQKPRHEKTFYISQKRGESTTEALRHAANNQGWFGSEPEVWQNIVEAQEPPKQYDVLKITIETVG
jgi:hypothetical protein